jgi:hypothetical protein
MVARYLLQQGCELAVEVPNANGKGADFKATKGGEVFFAHVKRLNVDDKTLAHHNWCYQQFLRLRELEGIPRPLLIEVNLKRRVTKVEAAHFVRISRPFIEQAREKDERLNVTAIDGEELGYCKVLHCSVMGGHVILCPDSDYQKPCNSARFVHRLKEAYDQFMPEAVNVILATSNWVNLFEFEVALFGDVDWYVDKKTGQIVKGAKLANGFWSGNTYSDSKLAVWFELRDEKIDFNLYVRQDVNPIVPQLLASLFTKANPPEWLVRRKSMLDGTKPKTYTTQTGDERCQ